MCLLVVRPAAFSRDSATRTSLYISKMIKFMTTFNLVLIGERNCTDLQKKGELKSSRRYYVNGGVSSREDITSINEQGKLKVNIKI